MTAWGGKKVIPIARTGLQQNHPSYSFLEAVDNNIRLVTLKLDQNLRGEAGRLI